MNKKSPRVVFWWPAVDPYMTDRFRVLAKNEGPRFEVWYSDFLENGRSWDVDRSGMDYPHRFLPAIGAGRFKTGIAFRPWLELRPTVVVTHHGNLSVAGSLAQHLVPGGKLVYYLEKTFDTWIPRTRFKEVAKGAILGNADAIMTPGRDSEAYARQYTGPNVPIFRLNHAIQVEHYSQALALRSGPYARIRRAELGLEGFVFLNVGRMWSQKGIDTLMEAAAALEHTGQPASFLFVGDGPDRDRYIAFAKSRGLSHVRFLDFVQQPDLPAIYALADAFVFPTRGDPYGLVVDEALASGLPVIASTSAGEIAERVIPNVSGILVPRDDSDALARAMTSLKDNADRAREMGLEGARLMKNRTPESWVQQFQEILEELL